MAEFSKYHICLKVIAVAEFSVYSKFNRDHRVYHIYSNMTAVIELTVYHIYSNMIAVIELTICHIYSNT